MSTNVLSARDVNTSAPTGNSAKNMDDSKPKSLEYHRQVLQSRMNEDDSKHSYVSPSDNIMSPCTAKLSAMKNKHFMKAKPQSLFAKASTKNAAAATGSGSSPEAALAASADGKKPQNGLDGAMDL